MLSGSGIPSNNRYFPGVGTFSFWAKTSSAATGAKLKLLLDDNDGTEIPPSLDVINDGQWHKYVWNLVNYNGTSPDTGNGVINSSFTVDFRNENVENFDMYIVNMDGLKVFLENLIEVNRQLI